MISSLRRVLLCVLVCGCATEIEVAAPEEPVLSAAAGGAPADGEAGPAGGAAEPAAGEPAAGDPGAGGTASPPEDGLGLTAAEAALLAAMNRERTARGLGPVAVSAGLLCAARRHSEDIGAAGLCSHTGTDGSTPTTRASACGADGWSGEIVACGQTSADAAVTAWIGSPGHNAILFDGGQRTVGVAMHQNFWTAIFDK